MPHGVSERYHDEEHTLVVVAPTHPMLALVSDAGAFTDQVGRVGS